MNDNSTIRPSKTLLALLMAAPWVLVGAELSLDAISPEATVILGIGAGVINLCTFGMRVATRLVCALARLGYTIEVAGRLQRETVQVETRKHAETLGSSLLSPVALMTAGFRGKHIADYDIAQEREHRRTDVAFDDMGTGPFSAFRG